MTTIIVLLILTGVAIVTLTGENGILNRAWTAKNMSEEAEEKEKNDLGELENLIAGKARDGLTEEQIRTIIREEIANANREEILWTNTNPTENFEAQTVSWTSTEYNNFYIVYKNYKGSSLAIRKSPVLNMNGARSWLSERVTNATEAYYWTRQYTFNPNKTSVQFYDCYFSDKTKSNHLGIPLYVVGYKGYMNFNSI